MNESLLKLRETVQNGEAKETARLTRALLEEGLDPLEILNKGLLPAMDELGGRFRSSEIFVPEVLIAARALNQGCAVLRERMTASVARRLGKVVIATVEGDLHDIGKNLLNAFMSSVGFNVIDLGVDVSVEEIVEAVRFHKPDILALSALLTITMKNQELVIKALEAAELREGLLIMVGGAPITKEFCKDIGADLFEEDAMKSAETALRRISNLAEHRHPKEVKTPLSAGEAVGIPLKTSNPESSTRKDIP